MKLIDKYLTKFQSDSIPISEVLPCWKELLSPPEDIILTNEELEYYKQKVSERWNFIKSDIHFISYLLDPRYYPFDLIPTEETNGYLMKISEFKANSQDEIISIFNEYVRFRICCQKMQRNNELLYLSLIGGHISIKIFWINASHQYPKLVSLANRVFSMVCTTDAAERSFSLQGRIHSKFQNRLSPNTILKLTYVKTNLKYIDNSLIYDIVNEDQNEESEEINESDKNIIDVDEVLSDFEVDEELKTN